MSDTVSHLELSIESFTLVPAKEGFPRYVALVELAAAAPQGALRSFCRQLDEALERHNVEYGSKRSSQRLAAPELWVVQNGSYDARRRRRLAQGTSDSQIKPTHLTRDPSFADAFEIVDRYHAD
jgi:hypothetical protein